MAQVSLGNIEFGITADIRQLEQAVRLIRQLGETTDRTARSQAAAAQAAAKQYSRQEQASINALLASRKLMDSMSKAGAPAEMIDRLNRRLTLFTQSLSKSNLNALEFDRTQRRWQVGLSNSVRALDRHNASLKANEAATKQTDAAWKENIKNANTLAKAQADIERAYVQRDRQQRSVTRAVQQQYRDEAAAASRAAAERKKLEDQTAREIEQGLRAQDRAREVAVNRRIALERRLAGVLGTTGLRTEAVQARVRQVGAPQVIADQAINARMDLRAALTAPGVTQEAAARALLAYRRALQDTTINLRDWQLSQQSGNRALRETATFLRQVEAASIKMGDAISRTTIQNERFQASLARVRNPTLQTAVQGLSGRATAATQSVQSVLADPTASRGQSAAALRTYREEMARLGNELSSFGSRGRQSANEMGFFQGRLKEAARSVELMTGPLGGVAVRLNVLSSILGSTNVALGLFIAGAAAGVFTFIKVSEAIIKFETELDTASRGMNAVNQSATVTALQMRQLMQIANETGTSFEELVKPFARWIEQTKGTGLEGARAIDIFKNMAFAAGQLGLPFERINAIMTNLQRSLARGGISGRELKGVLDSELPGATEAAAKALGTTTEGLDRMQKVGIGAEEFFSKFFRTYAESLGGYGSKVEGLSATHNRFRNSLVTLYDSLDKTFNISERYMATVQLLTRYVNNLAAATKGLDVVIKDLFTSLFAQDFKDVIKFLDLMASAFSALGNKEYNALDPIGNMLRGWGERLHGASESVKEYSKSSQEWNKAVTQQGSAIAQVLPSFQEFVESQRKAKFQTDPGATATYMGDVVAGIAQAKKDLKDYTDAFEETKRIGKDPLTDDDRYGRTLLGFGLKAEEAKKKLAELEKQKKELDAVASKPTGPDKFTPPPPNLEFEKALRVADKEIQKLQDELNSLGRGDTFFKRAKEDAQDTAAIESFTEHLRVAGTLNEEANKRIDEYRRKIRDVRVATREMTDIKTPFQVMEDMFKGLNGAMDTFTSAIFDGTLSMKTFGNIGKKILQDLLNEILKLGVLAPLMRSLFGTQGQSLGGSVGGGPGVGGFVGTLASRFGWGGGGTTSMPTMAQGGFGPDMPIGMGARGMAVTPGGFRFASGGIFGSPTMMPTMRGPILGGEAGAEALMPLTRLGNGKLGVAARISGDANAKPTGAPVSVHFHGAPPGTKVEERQDASGGRRLDAYFGDMVASQMGQQGSNVQKMMAGTFGVGPRLIRRGAA